MNRPDNFEARLSSLEDAVADLLKQAEIAHAVEVEKSKAEEARLAQLEGKVSAIFKVAWWLGALLLSGVVTAVLRLVLVQ